MVTLRFLQHSYRGIRTGARFMDFIIYVKKRELTNAICVAGLSSSMGSSSSSMRMVPLELLELLVDFEGSLDSLENEMVERAADFAA